ncbi:hypothetical protein lerEdw1_000674 [Lerista edwardsae]|nr:hypothetical protein lerEdw1_000674 [Lerista edwardsae]
MLGSLSFTVQSQNGSLERKKSTPKLPVPASPGYNLTKAHLDYTAKEFQKKLCAVYEDLVKACRAYDVGRSGFISLDYLKSVLNTFVFPIRSDVFQELMNRFGIKISKTMDWEKFFNSFHHPMLFDSGQVTPTAKHHRSRKLDEALSSDRILLKLHGHIQDAYSSLKKAFLMLDRNQDGKITRNELRQILDCIMFRISDDDFQELIKIIDPEHTGHLSYNMFLNLFEDKDSMDSKKKAKKPSSVLEAWNIAEDVLTEQVKGYWTEFSKALQACDPRSTGIISRNNFRKVLLLYCPSLTDDHFIALYQKYQDDTTEGVLYRMLLHSLGVADLPKELIAFASNPPTPADKQRGEKRQLDFSERMKQIEYYPYKYTRNRTVDEVIERLRDGILHQEAGLRDAFLFYNNQASGKLSKAEFRWLLEDIGLSMEDDQFSLLIEKLGFPAGGLSYLDFVAIFEENDRKTQRDWLTDLSDTETTLHPDMTLSDSRLIGQSTNRKAIVNKVHFLSAEECLSQLSERLTEEYGDPYIAFRKIDLNNDGKVTMLDFRRLLESLMFSITDDEYIRLLGLLGMNIISTLNFPEFLQLFQAHATKEMRPWLTPSYKKRNPEMTSQGCYNVVTSLLQAPLPLVMALAATPPPVPTVTAGPVSYNNCSFLRPKQKAADADLACEQAHYYLSIKAQTRWNDLSMFFHEYDNDGNGLVLKKDLKNILFRYGIPINPKEFEKLWARYDLNAKGYLTQQEFLQKMGVESPPDTSLHRPFIAENSTRFMEGYKKAEQKHIDVNEIISKIREKYHECSQEFHKAFLQQDKHREGSIKVGTLRKVLEDFHLPLGYQQYSELLYSLGIRIQDNKLSYFDFLRVIDDRAAFRRRRKHTVPPVPPISYMQLGIDEAMMKMKQIVTASADLLYKAFSAFDKEGTGAIPTLDFRQVLHHFCFTLSEKQFNHLLKLQRLRGEHSVDWKYFLQKFNFLSESERHHMKIACWELSNQEVFARIQEVVRARFPAIEREFKKADPARTKLVSKQDFRDICNRRFLLLTDEQFENLWNTVPLDLQGRLKYLGFLRKFGSEAVEMPDSPKVSYPEALGKPAAPPAAPPATPPTLPPTAPASVPPSAPATAPPTAPAEPGLGLLPRPQTAASPTAPKKAPAASRPHTAADHMPPIVNLQPIESKVRKIVQHCWKEILKECRAKDVDRLGEIPTEDLVAIIEKFHLNLTREEVKQLITKYDYKSVGKFAYSDFLQTCVLLFKHQEPTPMQRVVIQHPRGEKPTGPQSPTFFNAMMRIQPQILHCWRPMRRTFKFYDESGTGLLSVQDFRQVLRKYGINLSEEELFHILEYYDRTLSSRISYNEFLRAFLQ